jgi:hypothetical protein
VYIVFLNKEGEMNLMAESGEDLVAQTVTMDRAVWRKWNKYTWSGFLLIGVGLIMIAAGLLLNTGAYSAEGLLLGFGAIVILIGIVRVFIGLINPLAPGDILRRRRREGGTDSILAVVDEDPTQL